MAGCYFGSGDGVIDGIDNERLNRFVSERIELHLRRYCARSNISRMELIIGGGLSTQMFAMIDRCAEQLSFQLVHDVYSAGEATRTFTLEASFVVPSTWLDAFKERFRAWIPGWALKRWPIRTKVLSKTETHTVDAVALLPGIPPRIGEKRVHFAVQVVP